jgi:hypothetical protein
MRDFYQYLRQNPELVTIGLLYGLVVGLLTFVSSVYLETL